MANVQLTPQGAGVWLVQGDIDYNSVITLQAKGDRVIEAALEPCRFDFSAVGSVNTVALAMLFGWQRLAREHNAELEFLNLPGALLAIAQLSDLQTLLIPRK